MTDALEIPGSEGGESTSGDTVLLVEDSRAIASLLVNRLESLRGVRCRHVDTCAETRQLLEAEGGDFLAAILDLNLSDAPDGEAVGLVRSYGIPVIVLTGSLDDRRRDYFMQHQVADYVSKNQLSGVESVVHLIERMQANRSFQVLVVDDSQAQRAYVCGLLHNHGYQTIQASDGREAIQLLQAHPSIRLVLIDYHMPNMDGLSLVQQIRRQRSEDELAIIGVSSAGEKGILARFLKSGANDFLTKPFEIEELYCRIDQNLDMLRYIHEARDAANRDFLTRLYNRRYFFEYAEELHAGALRGELRLLVAMIDADHFKRINDSYGHQMGDAALVEMASVLRTQAGVSGVPARFGGEEFVCIKALDEGQDPAVCLEQLRCAIEAVDLRAANGERIPLTVSIGATTNPRTSIDQMLLVADGAVYLAKKQGRNRVVVLNSFITDESATTRVRRDDR